MGAAQSKFRRMIAHQYHRITTPDPPVVVPEPPMVTYFIGATRCVYDKEDESCKLTIVLTNHGDQPICIWPTTDILNMSAALVSGAHHFKYIDCRTHEVVNTPGKGNEIPPVRLKKRLFRRDTIDLVVLPPGEPITIGHSLNEGRICQGRMFSGGLYEIRGDGDQDVARWAIGLPYDVIKRGNQRLGYNILRTGPELMPITLTYYQPVPCIVSVL